MSADPGIVEVPSPSGDSFDIDAHETTVAEYAAWLATRPTLAGQRSECAWNDSFAPGVPSPIAIEAAEDAGNMFGACTNADWLAQQLEDGNADRPVACIDWCDAVAYCTWAGKHLCGRIGGGPTIDSTNGGGAYQDAAVSQWYRACSNAGTRPFPYGDAYVEGRCNDSNIAPKAVGSLPECNGGYAGIYDMSGNVSEWDDACTQFGGPAAFQNCCVRGGAFYGTADGLSCDALAQIRRCYPAGGVGLRCCRG